jgi:predicted lipid-binding transport protein (Tim44 family)
MPHNRDNGPSDSPGLLGQMSRLRSHTGATAAELREFVRHLRGRSPQEVIGVLAQSDLIRATVLAAGCTLVLLLGFTIAPALLAKPKAPVAAATAAPPADAAPAKPDGSTKPGAAAAAPAAAADAPANPGKPSKDDIAGKLGIGDAKPTNSKKNPLELQADDLFKDVK